MIIISIKLLGYTARDLFLSAVFISFRYPEVTSAGFQFRKNCTVSEVTEVSDKETAQSEHKEDITVMITDPSLFLSELPVED
jgi:hypothetical protein